MLSVAPNPVFFTLGPVEVRYYGLVYALGFLFAYWFLRQLSTKGRISITHDHIDIYMIYVIIGGIVGARIGEFLFFQPHTFLADPLEIFRIWHGGMSIQGGILGFAGVTWLFCKKYKYRFYELSDAVIIPATLSLFFGRIANFINAELVGRKTSVAWAVNWFGETNKSGELVGRHPSQLYEALKNLSMFVFFMVLEQQQKVKRTFKEGYYTWMFIFLYGVLRTIVTIWRDDTLWFFGILSTGQFISVIMAIIAGTILIQYYWRGKQYLKRQHNTTRKTR